MTFSVRTTELVVFVFFIVVMTVLGFLAARWRNQGGLYTLDEWALGGRRFGTVVTWFAARR